MDLQTPPASEAPSAPEIETPAAPVEAPKPQEDENLAKRFEALARKEKNLVTMRQRLKAMETEIKEKQKTLSDFESLKKLSRENPEEFLKRFDTDYQSLTDFYLNRETPTADTQVKLVREEIENLKKAQEEFKRQQMEEQAKKAKAEEEAMIEAFQEEISDFLSSHADDYELTLSSDTNQALVFDTIQEVYNQTGKILSKKEAADRVEEYLEEQLLSLKALKKFKLKFGLQDEPKEGEEIKSVAQDSKTLSNLTPSSSVPSNLPPQTEADRLKRALAKLNGI